MKFTLKNFTSVLLAVVGGMLLLVATAQGAEEKKIKITISPAVQEQMQMLNPSDRKKIEAAIQAGNRFIPYHFNGQAYDMGSDGNERELKYWLKNIRPLVNRDVTEWYSDIDLSQAVDASLKIDGLPNELSASTVAVCPQIELISITVADEHYDVGWKIYYPVNFSDDSFVLKYQVRSVGTLNLLRQPPTEFFLDKKNNFVAAIISLDKERKVNKVIAQYGVSTWSMRHYTDILKRYINGTWSENVTVDEKNKLKQLVRQMNDEEIRVCARETVSTKQPSIKE